MTEEALDFQSLLRQALRAGAQVQQFWDMTPMETYAFVEAWRWRDERTQKQQLTQAWYTAALSRSKKLPALKQLLGPARPKPVSRQELKRRIKEQKEQVAAVDLSNLDHLLKKRKGNPNG